MKKKYLGYMLAFVFAILLCGFNVKADGIQTTRLGDYDRYGTNIKVVQQGWQKSDCAIIVGGENFPDALSAAPLAKKYNAPIFLTLPTGIDYKITDELDRLGVKKVFIIGGPNIIPTLTEDTLKSKGIAYERIYGQDRYETSIDIANKVGTKNGVVVATGDDYPDALSIAPIAGKLQMPIILSQKDVLESVQKKFITNNSIPKTYILGNTDIISDNVASKFSNVERIATEDNRFARNLDIVDTFKSDIDFSTAVLASGANFPDALSGSALAALNGNPVILVGKYSYFNHTECANNNDVETLLGANGTKNIDALGLNFSISDNNLNDIVGGTNALNAIKSKVTLDQNLGLKMQYEKYSYDGSNYYRITVYERKNGLDLYNFYQYDFLVDVQTGDTYKIDIDTKEITPLDSIQIDTNNSKHKAVEAVANCIPEKDSHTEIEYERIENENGINYYRVHAYDDLHDHLSTVGFYDVDVSTGKVYERDYNDAMVPIN